MCRGVISKIGLVNEHQQMSGTPPVENAQQNAGKLRFLRKIRALRFTTEQGVSGDVTVAL